MIPSQMLSTMVLPGKAVLTPALAPLEGAVDELLLVRRLDVPFQIGFAAVGLFALGLAGGVDAAGVVAVAGVVGGGAKRGGGCECEWRMVGREGGDELGDLPAALVWGSGRVFEGEA